MSHHDAHLLHAIRQAKREQVIPPSPAAIGEMPTQPAALDDVPPVPAWMRPVPRRREGCSSTPLITYQRQRHGLRDWCDRLPLLVPVARVLF